MKSLNPKHSTAPPKAAALSPRVDVAALIAITATLDSALLKSQTSTDKQYVTTKKKKMTSSNPISTQTKVKTTSTKDLLADRPQW